MKKKNLEKNEALGMKSPVAEGQWWSQSKGGLPWAWMSWRREMNLDHCCKLGCLIFSGNLCAPWVCTALHPSLAGALWTVVSGETRVYRSSKPWGYNHKKSTHISNEVWVSQLCLNPWNPMDCTLPGSSVHGILQARILEWVIIPLSRESSRPKDWTRGSVIAGRFFTI